MMTVVLGVPAVYALAGYGTGMTPVQAVLALLAASALVLGVCCMLYRRDIASLIRARRHG